MHFSPILFAAIFHKKNSRRYSFAIRWLNYFWISHSIFCSIDHFCSLSHLFSIPNRSCCMHACGRYNIFDRHCPCIARQLQWSQYRSSHVRFESDDGRQIKVHSISIKKGSQSLSSVCFDQDELISRWDKDLDNQSDQMVQSLKTKIYKNWTCVYLVMNQWDYLWMSGDPRIISAFWTIYVFDVFEEGSNRCL